jgi:hypothetical protein
MVHGETMKCAPAVDAARVQGPSNGDDEQGHVGGQMRALQVAVVEGCSMVGNLGKWVQPKKVRRGSCVLIRHRSIVLCTCLTPGPANLVATN